MMYCVCLWHKTIFLHMCESVYMYKCVNVFFIDTLHLSVSFKMCEMMFILLHIHINNSFACIYKYKHLCACCFTCLHIKAMHVLELKATSMMLFWGSSSSHSNNFYFLLKTWPCSLNFQTQAVWHMADSVNKGLQNLCIAYGNSLVPLQHLPCGYKKYD